ncbi:hypothetical protein BD779DRAFT_1474954 [Infundibulicybe gibba]|nr:hypothetical protein BD779DRAFT_1474954 [Infundibulicybe gibba]
MPANSHTDFAIPTGTDVSSYMVAMAYAYSAQWNNPACVQRIGGPPVLYRKKRYDDQADTSAATLPGKISKNLCPDFAAIYMQYSLREECQSFHPKNTPFPTFPGTSTSSLPRATQIQHFGGDHLVPLGYDAMDYIPPSSNIPPQQVINWHLLKIDNVQTIMIAELKQLATRRAACLQDFVSSLQICMNRAQLGATLQAEHAFESYPDSVHTLVALACCGEWWSWAIIKRPPEENNDNMLDEVDSGRKFVPDDDKEPGDEAESDDDGAMVPYRPKGTAARPGFEPVRYVNLGDAMEHAKENSADAEPEVGDWSLPILLGSPASNQRFYLIREHLKRLSGDF